MSGAASEAPSDRRLTTHVLDLTRGLPAAGLGLTLARLDGDRPTVLVEAVTNLDGRTDGALLTGDALVPGRYELSFEVGAYFAGPGPGPGPGAGAGASGLDRYLDVVPVRFGVAGTPPGVHVALLVTPWSYTTYRGS